MKSKHHEYYTKNGFKYHEGRSCGCTSYYHKSNEPENKALVIQVKRCRNGKPHVRCPWEWVFAKNGEIIQIEPETTIPEFENFVNETLCLTS